MLFLPDRESCLFLSLDLIGEYLCKSLLLAQPDSEQSSVLYSFNLLSEDLEVDTHPRYDRL